MNARGRRPDPEIDVRILQAARQVFLEVGWVALTMDAIASRAHVGKAALYSRWSTKERLIADALRQVIVPYEAIDAGSLRRDLRLLAEQFIDDALGDAGMMARRATFEARLNPELFDAIHEAFHQAGGHAARKIVRRAIERGELSRRTRAGWVLDMLNGTIANHIDALSPVMRAQFAANRRRYAEQVVDLVIAAFRDGSS